MSWNPPPNAPRPDRPSMVIGGHASPDAQQWSTGMLLWACVLASSWTVGLVLIGIAIGTRMGAAQ